jgi:hypothetical protein
MRACRWHPAANFYKRRLRQIAVLWAALGHAKTPARASTLYCFGIGGHARPGHKRKSPRQIGRSALLSTADIVRPPSHVRFVPKTEAGPTRSPRQHGREARAAFAIIYDRNPDQDGRPSAPALQALRLQSWYTSRHSKDGIFFNDRQS